MNFLIGVSLSHFCEYHGPVVIMFTEAVSYDEFKKIEKFFHDFPVVKKEENQFCDGCMGFEKHDPGLVSFEESFEMNKKDVFISSRKIYDDRLRETINQSCIRSITSEQYPCQQGPMVFVEEGAYSTFSYKFLLKDFCSRGFKRSYLINIVCSDKFHLINSWNFISDNLEVVVAKMKADAEKQFNKEHLIHSDGLGKKSLTKASKDLDMILIWKDKSYQRKQSRSLAEITNNFSIFLYMHSAFISLLKGMQLRITKTISFNSRHKKVDGDSNKLEETTHGFVKVFKCDKKIPSGSCVSLNCSNIRKYIQKGVQTFPHPRVLLKVLGVQNFNDLLHHLLVGHQVLVRAKEKELLLSIIECLKIFLPSHAEKWITPFTDIYNIEHKDKLIVGMSLLPLLPFNLSACLVLDVSGVHMLKKNPFLVDCWIYKKHKKQIDELALRYYMITLEKLNVFYQEESFLESVQTILQNENLESSLGDFCLHSLKQEWIVKAKIFNAYSRWKKQESEIMQVIGTKKKDQNFLKYWAKRFCPMN